MKIDEGEVNAILLDEWLPIVPGSLIYEPSEDHEDIWFEARGRAGFLYRGPTRSIRALRYGHEWTVKELLEISYDDD